MSPYDTISGPPTSKSLLPVSGKIQGCHEVGQHVVNGDRLRGRRDPPRAHHHGQPLDECLDQLEGQAAGADDDRGTKLDDRNTTRSEYVAGLGPAP